MSETTTVQVSSAPESTTVRVAGTEETTVVAVGPELTTVVGSGEIGPRGPAGPGSGSIADITAAVDLSGHRVVLTNASGQAIYANPMDTSHVGRSVWLTEGAITAGATGPLLAMGEITEPSWSWTPEARLYLGPTGTLVADPPEGAAFWLQVATAITATTVFFGPQIPIRLT